VLKGKDLYTSQEESSSSDSDISHSSDSQEHSYPNEGKLLMIRGFSITNLAFLSMIKEKIFSTQDARF